MIAVIHMKMTSSDKMIDALKNRGDFPGRKIIDPGMDNYEISFF